MLHSIPKPHERPYAVVSLGRTKLSLSIPKGEAFPRILPFPKPQIEGLSDRDNLHGNASPLPIMLLASKANIPGSGFDMDPIQISTKTSVEC